MRNTFKTTTAAALAALALVATPAIAAKTPAKPATAAKPAAPAAGQAPDPQVEHAMLYLKVLISALQSEKVDEPAKSALVGCLYNNSLSKITDSMDKVIAENPGKITRDNPSELLSVMVRICGYTPTAASAAPGAVPAPAPAGSPTKSSGR